MTGLLAGAGVPSLGAAFVELSDGFERAAERLGLVEQPIRLDSQAIRLRIAGQAMAARVLPALQHLAEPESPDRAPDLVVKVWDTAGSEVRLPDLPPAIEGSFARPYDDGQVLLLLRTSESSVSAIDRARGEAVHCVSDAERVGPHDVAHPLSDVLGWWLAASGCYRVHAAAVGTAGGGALLAGASGHGKSTSALTCLRAGMRFAGDDMVLLRPDPPTAVSLYNTGRADRDLLRRYPDAFPRLEQPSGDEKAVCFFPREAITHELPLRAVVLPRVVPGGRCRVGPGRKAAALLAVAPWVAIYSAGAGQAAVAEIRGLLAALPVHTLDVGDDLGRIPELISELIEGSPACS